MALTETQKFQTFECLGYHSQGEDADLLLQKITIVEANVNLEARVTGVLTRLDGINTQLDTARNVVGSAYDQLLSEAQRQCYLLSNTLGVEVKRKVYR